MVGQTLSSKGRTYTYYRCRHAYDKNTGYTCPGRYIRSDDLEAGVWNEVTRVLTHPEIVLNEIERVASESVDQSEVDESNRALAHLDEREKRLTHLYTLGQVNDEARSNT